MGASPLNARRNARSKARPSRKQTSLRVHFYLFIFLIFFFTRGCIPFPGESSGWKSTGLSLQSIPRGSPLREKKAAGCTHALGKRGNAAALRFAQGSRLRGGGLARENEVIAPSSGVPRSTEKAKEGCGGLTACLHAEIRRAGVFQLLETPPFFFCFTAWIRGHGSFRSACSWDRF